MKTELISINLILCFCLLLSGCMSGGVTGTVSPDHVVVHKDAGEIPIDSSTPSQYDNQNGGRIWKNRDEHGKVISCVITYNAVQRYNAWIAKYRIQFRTLKGVDLSPNDGVKPFVDQYGNNLFVMDAEHYLHFMGLADLNRREVPPDSGWDKLKDMIP